MSYNSEIRPSVGTIESTIVGTEVLPPGEYVGKIMDIQPVDESDTVFVFFTTDRGLHTEELGVDVVSGIRPGVPVKITIEKFPGYALCKHQNKYAVIDENGKRVSAYAGIGVATDELRKYPIARIGVSKVEVI